MPKVKTNSGAKKRFRLTGSGKLRGRHAFTSHNRQKKSAKRKRALEAPVPLAHQDYSRVRRLLRLGVGR